jgi:hypothetical protein
MLRHKFGISWGCKPDANLYLNTMMCSSLAHLRKKMHDMGGGGLVATTTREGDVVPVEKGLRPCAMWDSNLDLLPRPQLPYHFRTSDSVLGAFIFELTYEGLLVLPPGTNV